MKAIALFSFLIIFCLYTVDAQEAKEVAVTPLNATSFVGVDTYKSLYFIKDMVLHKTGTDGNYVFNDFQLGPIAQVDIINPLKVVIFYRDTNTVVFVDNRLNEIERINFNNLPNFINVGAATNAGNNRLWLFNMDTQQLELFNYRLLLETVVSQPFTGSLKSIASNFNYCYTLTDKKIRAFNIYGSLLAEMDAHGFDKIYQQNENVFALRGNELVFVAKLSQDEPLAPFRKIALPLSENSLKDLHLTQDFLYLYDGKNLRTLTLTLPKN